MFGNKNSKIEKNFQTNTNIYEDAMIEATNTK